MDVNTGFATHDVSLCEFLCTIFMPIFVHVKFESTDDCFSVYGGSGDHSLREGVEVASFRMVLKLFIFISNQ